MANIRQIKDRGMNITFFCIAAASITVLFTISVFLFVEGLPIFKVVSVKNFIIGTYWYPTSDPPDFRIFPIIIGLC